MRTIFLSLIVFTLFIALQAQNEVELTEIKPFHYVYMEFKGYNRFEDFNKYLPRLTQEIENQGLSSSIFELVSSLKNQSFLNFYYCLISQQ